MKPFQWLRMTQEKALESVWWRMKEISVDHCSSRVTNNSQDASCDIQDHQQEQEWNKYFHLLVTQKPAILDTSMFRNCYDWNKIFWEDKAGNCLEVGIFHLLTPHQGTKWKHAILGSGFWGMELIIS